MTEQNHLKNRLRTEKGMEFTPEEKDRLRAWTASPAPGEDKLGNRITGWRPPLARSPRQRRWRGIAQHFATGALLFLGGYVLGQRKEVTPNQPQTQAVVSPVQTSASAGNNAVASVDSTLEAKFAAASEPSVRASASDCKPSQMYEGKDGNIRIETVLCQSGSRATWVINPRLEIASAKHSEKNEETHP